MIQNLLTQVYINSLVANTDISIQIPVSSSDRGFVIENITPYYYQFNDQNGVLLYYIEPWQIVQDNFNAGETFRTITSMTTTRPQIQSNSAPSTTWALNLDKRGINLPQKTVNLAVSNAANVTLSGTNEVSISGTVVTNVQGAVQLAAGTTVDANIQNATLDVSGSNVNAQVSGAVTVSNNNLNVTTQAGSEVTVSNTIDANIQNASIDTNSTILNEYITALDTYTNDSNPFTASVNVAPGATQEIVIGIPSSVYDSLAIAVYSANGELSNYSFTLDQVRYQPPGKTATWISSLGTFGPEANGDNTAEFKSFYPLYFTPLIANEFVIGLKNNGASQISDNVSVYIFATKATTTINNQSSNPALQQAVTGAYATQENFNISGGGQASTSPANNTVLIPSSVGGYLQTLNISLFTTYSSINVTINNGSAQIATLQGVTGSKTYEFSFGSGVVNNGITVTGDSGNDTWSMSGYGAIVQNTPPGVPKTIA